MPTPEEIKTVKATLAKFERAKELQKELAKLTAELAEYGLTLPKDTTKSIAASGVKSGKRKKTEAVILDILKETSNLSCAAIQANPKMVALYDGGEVAPQAIKLTKMVDEKKLVKTGKGKKAVYSLP